MPQHSAPSTQHSHGFDGPAALEDILVALAVRPPSSLFAHPGPCCQVARAWFSSMALSMGAQESGPPRWIRERWKWGPAEWPLHWCEAIAAERLDCGALAALGRCAVETAGGVALSVQLVERFDSSAVEAWRGSWRDVQSIAPWTWVDFVYHEAIALLDEKRVSIWDTTVGCWLDEKATVGYESVAAVRIWPLAAAEGSAELPSVHWRGRSFDLGIWHRL